MPPHRYSYSSYWCYRSLLWLNICCPLAGFQAGPSTARSLSIVYRSSIVARDRKVTTITSTCVTSLSELEIGVVMRCDSSHAGSRHGRICEIREQKNRMLYATISEILALRSRLPVIWKHPPRGLGQGYVATQWVLLSAARAYRADFHIDERVVRGSDAGDSL